MFSFKNVVIVILLVALCYYFKDDISSFFHKEVGNQVVTGTIDKLEMQTISQTSVDYIITVNGQLYSVRQKDFEQLQQGQQVSLEYKKNPLSSKVIQVDKVIK